MTYQEKDKKKLLRQGDRVLFRVFGHPVTINEIHATMLAFSGIIFGAMYAEGFAAIAGPVAMLLIAYAILGNPALRSMPHGAEGYVKTIGMKTIKHEPWWFIPPFIVAFVVGLYVGGDFASIDPDTVRVLADTVFELFV